MFLQRLVGNGTGLLHRYLDDRRSRRAREVALNAAIERVVDEAVPRLRALSGYRRKLRQPVSRAMEFAAWLVEDIPGPVELSARSWNADPMVNTFFSGVQDLRRVLTRSHQVQECFKRHPDPDAECFALLSMKRSEHSVLGAEMSGDLLRREVRQTTVSFSKRRLVDPSESEAWLRRDLAKRILEALVAHALERISELEASRDSLEEQRRMLNLQLKLAHAQDSGFESLVTDEQSAPVDMDYLQGRRRAAEEKLAQIRNRIATLDDYLERVVEVLGHPEEYMDMEDVPLILDKLNVKREVDTGGACRVLNLAECSLNGRRRRVLLTVRFSRAELLPREHFLEEAERMLH